MSARQPASDARLRFRLASRFALRDLTISLEGATRPYTVTLPADPDAPLDQMAERMRAPQALRESPPARRRSESARAADVARATVADGAHLPYWALLWPSGLALAEALLAEPASVRAVRTLELGCGLGVTAAVALDLGARLTVSDLFADALLFAEYNTQRCVGCRPA